jgi:hypothetical protein
MKKIHSTQNFTRLFLATAMLFAGTLLAEAQTQNIPKLSLTQSATSRNAQTPKKESTARLSTPETKATKGEKKLSKAEANLRKRLPKNYDDSKTNIPSKTK